MTVVEFDAWISGEAEGAYGWTTHAERSERTQLEAMRELFANIRERRQLTMKLQAEIHSTVAPGDEAATPSRRAVEDRLHDASPRIRQLTSYLQSAGWEGVGLAR